MACRGRTGQKASIHSHSSTTILSVRALRVKKHACQAAYLRRGLRSCDNVSLRGAIIEARFWALRRSARRYAQ
jgi:hypothetical protein